MKIPDEVKRLARAGKDQKIYAVRALRAETGVGLVLAKEIIETIAAGGEVQLAPVPKSDLPKEQSIRRQMETICGDGRPTVSNSDDFRTLLQILKDDERVLDLIVVTHNNREGFLVATQRRLVFMTGIPAGSPTVEDFPLDQVCLIYHKPGVVRDSITVFMGGSNKAEFTSVAKDVARSFDGRLDIRPTGRTPFEPADEAEALEWLEAKYQSGALSTEEFNDGKREILVEFRQPTRRQTQVRRRPS